MSALRKWNKIVIKGSDQPKNEKYIFHLHVTFTFLEASGFHLGNVNVVSYYEVQDFDLRPNCLPDVHCESE